MNINEVGRARDKARQWNALIANLDSADFSGHACATLENVRSPVTYLLCSHNSAACSTSLLLNVATNVSLPLTEGPADHFPF